MDWMTKLGGRKFLMAIIVIGTAIYLEASGKGLSPTMAGFLVAVVGAFSVTNIVSSNAQIKQKNNDSLNDKVDELHEKMDDAMSPERSGDLQQLLTNINTGVIQLQSISGQMAQGLIHQNTALQNLNKRA